MREYFEYSELSLPRSHFLPGKFNVYWKFTTIENRTRLGSTLVDAETGQEAIDTAVKLMPDFARSRLIGTIKAVPARSDDFRF